MPKQKRARGRPKKNWMEDIRKAMNERNLNEGQWEDKKHWNLGVGQHRKSFETDIYIYILYYVASIILFVRRYTYTVHNVTRFKDGIKPESLIKRTN
jgi:hypothetical protein